MLFTATTFWVFFVVVVAAVATNLVFIRSVTIQNVILFVASMVFYAAWDVRFLGLILFNVLIAWVYYRLPDRMRSRRKVVALACAVPLLVLATFKYLNFLVAEFGDFMRAIGAGEPDFVLNIILPVGISFYTFQTISFIVDVRRGDVRGPISLLEIATFITFFPQLVAGPIERASRFMPQLKNLSTPTREQLFSGVHLIIIGMALKIGVADVLAGLADPIFERDPATVSGGDHAKSMLFFTVQIYADFCGYSTIAIGLAKLLGLDLMTNFQTPYLAQTLQDFWQRWHISLSSFFRDYVYIPLGGSRNGAFTTYRNLFLTFVLSGLWHGANWTFVIWGALHGAYIVIERILGWHRPRSSRIGRVVYRLWLFAFVAMAFMVFRAPDIGHAVTSLTRIVTDPSLPTHFGNYAILALGLWLLIDVAWDGNPRLEKPFGLFRAKNALVGWYHVFVLTVAIWTMIVTAHLYENTAFVYFQF